jgi:DNA-binding IclR family transcriptional regulator
LEDIRAAGGIEFSTNEVRPGISALASIIHNRRGTAVGAIAVSGADLGAELSRESAVAGKLARTASSIAHALR